MHADELVFVSLAIPGPQYSIVRSQDSSEVAVGLQKLIFTFTDRITCLNILLVAPDQRGYIKYYDLY